MPLVDAECHLFARDLQLRVYGPEVAGGTPPPPGRDLVKYQPDRVTLYVAKGRVVRYIVG